MSKRNILIDVDRMKALADFPSMNAAEKKGDASGISYDIVTSAADFVKTYTLMELTQLWNQHADKGKEVKKFSDKKAASAKVWDLITHVELKMGKMKKTVDKEIPDLSKPAKKSRKAIQAKVAKKGKVVTQTLKTMAKNSGAGDKPKSKRGPTVASTLKGHILAGKSKNQALSLTRKKFPEKIIPNSYFSWYTKDLVKRGELKA